MAEPAEAAAARTTPPKVGVWLIPSIYARRAMPVFPNITATICNSRERNTAIFFADQDQHLSKLVTMSMLCAKMLAIHSSLIFQKGRNIIIITSAIFRVQNIMVTTKVTSRQRKMYGKKKNM